jgi:hypothetical protein
VPERGFAGVWALGAPGALPALVWRLASSPHQSRLLGLTAEAQYAAIELFRGTMVRHGVVAYRTDRPAQDAPVDFDGDSRLRYTPIRLPDTLAVQDRLPKGAAAFSEVSTVAHSPPVGSPRLRTSTPQAQRHHR